MFSQQSKIRVKNLKFKIQTPKSLMDIGNQIISKSTILVKEFKKDFNSGDSKSNEMFRNNNKQNSRNFLYQNESMQLSG